MNRLVSCIVALVVAAPSMAAPPRIEPGLWRIHTEVTNNGVPEPATDEDVCVTPDEVKDVVKYFMPERGDIPGKCTPSHQPAKGDSLSYRMQCAGKGFTVDLRATVTFATAERYMVEARSDSKQGGKAIVAITKATARRVGPCPK